MCTKITAIENLFPSSNLIIAQKIKVKFALITRKSDEKAIFSDGGTNFVEIIYEISIRCCRGGGGGELEKKRG